MNFFVNRNWKKLIDSRKRAKILADNRKSHHPIETLYYGRAVRPAHNSKNAPKLQGWRMWIWGRGSWEVPKNQLRNKGFPCIFRLNALKGLWISTATTFMAYDEYHRHFHRGVFPGMYFLSYARHRNENHVLIILLFCH